MATGRTRPGRKVPHISYADFRNAANSDACCAGAGADRTTELATMMVRRLEGTEPAAMLEEALNQGDRAPVHGVWHHALVGEILLISLRNAGYAVADELIDEVIDRGRQIPGGACGFLGTCGALASAASAYAILVGSTPVASERREKLIEFSAKLWARLAEIGGSRCCKKSSYAALEVARDEFAELGLGLPEEEFEHRCPFFAANQTCDGKDCVYFPTER